jgi:hypothetical protein
MRGLSIIPLLILFSFAACKKPASIANDDFPTSTLPPLVLRASLKDTLSLKALKALQLDDLAGVKIKYNSGNYASYFEYEADREVLLKTMASLPFPKYAIKADTVCYQVSYRDLASIRQRITPTEYEASAFFWDTAIDEYDVFECLKSPMRHTLLISKRTKKIYHRIEYTG